jgi:excinuclease ABC subunit C
MAVALYVEHLKQRAANLPASPGVYLFKDVADRVIYVGKAKNLRDRVRSYFSKDRLANPKTDTLIAEAFEIDYIAVANEKEALGLENNLIKERQPRFNVLLRDDKTYPYIKLTKERFPRVYVTRQLHKDGATYFGPYFPANLAHRLVNFIHRYFKIPSCRVDLTRLHSRPCLEYHIHRCWGPCVEGLTDDEEYGNATTNVRMFLGGHSKELAMDLHQQMLKASDNLEFEKAAALRDLIKTAKELNQRQRVAAAEGKDVDIFGVYAEPPLVAVNLFHLRNGRVVDRREFYWENVKRLDTAEFTSSFLKQVYLNQQYVPSFIHTAVDFEDRELLEIFLTEKRGSKVEILTPRRGPKKSMLELVENNAQHCFEQRFRVMKPNSKAMMLALADVLNLEKPPERIECFDVSHIQGSDTVASMVVAVKGRMCRSEYRKFIIRSTADGDDFAAMREVIGRRYRRVQREHKSLPGLVLVDGGVGQLHSAAGALESLNIINQPVAAIAKREETIFVLGQENEPIRLDHFSPILHLIQMIRNEAHRFAVTFHRKRRNTRQLTSLLMQVEGVGEKSAKKLLRTFGSLERVRTASVHDLTTCVNRRQAQKIHDFLST